MHNHYELERRLGENRTAFGLFHPVNGNLPLSVIYVALLSSFPTTIKVSLIDNDTSRCLCRRFWVRIPMIAIHHPLWPYSIQYPFVILVREDSA